MRATAMEIRVIGDKRVIGPVAPVQAGGHRTAGWRRLTDAAFWLCVANLVVYLAVSASFRRFCTELVRLTGKL
jgi:hypothetical protein